MSLRVGILEDDPLTRITVSEALQNRGFKVVISASNAADFISGFAKTPIDVGLLDLHLGDGPTGLDVAKHIRSKSKIVGIVFLTSFSDPRLLSGSSSDYPKGSRYLVKKSVVEMDTLVQEIDLAVADTSSVDQGLDVGLRMLSDTQIQTLRMIAEGYSNAEIARQRFVAEKTVEASIARIARQLILVLPPGHNARMHMAQVYFRARGLDIGNES
jgi:DNA-binding NarL/FixJ family response regulator